NEQVKNLRKIRVNIKNQDLDAAMKTVLSGLPLTYAIQGETILIKPSSLPLKESVLEKTLQEIVSGRVVNERGQPLPAVSVSTTDGTNSTQTNEQGTFQLQNVDGSARLRFSMLGYQRVEYPVNNLPSQVVLREEVSNLDEIVVTGYGVQERR